MMLTSMVDDFTNNPNHFLRDLLIENDLSDWAPYSLTYLFHGEADELVPYENSLIAFNSFIDNGSENIYLYTVPEELGGHQEAAVYCLISAYQISEDNYKNIRNIGDLNNDSTLNIQDILIILSYILDEIEYNGLDLWLSDLNHSGSLNIQDIIILIGQILDI